jgi:hypothetical protein
MEFSKKVESVEMTEILSLGKTLELGKRYWRCKCCFKTVWIIQNKRHTCYWPFKNGY